MNGFMGLSCLFCILLKLLIRWKGLKMKKDEKTLRVLIMVFVGATRRHLLTLLLQNTLAGSFKYG